MEAFFNIFRYLANGFVDRPAHGAFVSGQFFSVHCTGTTDQVELVMNQSPHPVEKPERAVNTLITPVKIFFRWCGKQ